MENKYDVSSLYENYSIEEVSMDDIISIIEGASINKLNTDGTTSLFSDELVTYLYSGFVSDEIHSNQVVISMENVRILDLTEAAYLLSDKGFKQLILEAFTNDILNGKYSLNSMLELIQKGISIDEKNELLALMSKGKDMSALEIERVAEIARGGFLYEPEKGAWAMISKRFVKATSKSSIIECYSTLANLERTWAKVEVITLLGNLPDSQVVGKTTIGELKMINESKGINAVYEKMISDSRELANSTRLYFDNDGKLVGASNYRTSYKNNANFDINVYEYDNAIVHFGEDGKIVGISTDNSCYSGYSKFDERLRIVSKYLSEEDMIDKYHNYNLKSGLKK